MKKYFVKNHSLDLLFTVSLFFFFTITSLYVTMAGADLYERTVRQSSRDYPLFTTLSYLEQKVQRYDSSGGISLQKEENQDILCLHETIGEDSYTTYIYTLDGRLMELFQKSETSFSPENGDALMECGTLHLEEKKNLLHIYLTDSYGTTQTLTLHLKTREG